MPLTKTSAANESVSAVARAGEFLLMLTPLGRGFFGVGFFLPAASSASQRQCNFEQNIALELTGLLNRSFGNAFDVLPFPTISVPAL